jgi:hypothetical protein
MILAEERTQKRSDDGRDNWENYDNRGNQGGHQNRNRRPNNMVASTDKSKKSSKPRRFEDLENLPCPWHPNSSHTASDWWNFKNYTRKNDSAKGKGKLDDDNKDQEDQRDKGFQKSKGVVNIIFAGVPSSKSKQQEKLALRSISAAESAIPSTSIGPSTQSNSRERISRPMIMLNITHWF